MNETSFVAAVHRRLGKEIYHHKNLLPLASGVPDVWYSGPRGDLWIEYKWLSAPPLRKHKPNLTLLQAEWLNSRYDEGRNVAVVVGTPGGVLLYLGKTWNASQPVNLMPIQELTTWIKHQAGSKSDDNQ